MVSTLPAQLVAMPFSPADTGMKAIEAGETVDSAQKSALIDTLGNTAGVALPASMGGNLLKRMATGAAGNVAQDVAVREAIQGVSDTKEMKQQFENTPETMALSGILGAGFGMLPSGKPNTITPDAGTREMPNVKADKISGMADKENAPDPTKMIETSLTSYSTLLREAQKVLDGVKDKSSQFYLDKLNEVNHLNKLVETLEIELGKKKATEPTENTPETVVEPPRIDEQPPVDTRVAPEENKSIVEPPVHPDDVIPNPVFKDKYDVNSEIMGTDISGYSKVALTNMLESKQQKISSGEYSPETVTLLKQEQAKIESALRGKPVEPISAFDIKQPVWSKAAELTESMKTNGIRGGLEYIAKTAKDYTYGNSKYLGHLANKLLNNPLIRGNIELDANFKYEGGFNNETGQVTFRNQDSVSPYTVLHEVVHKAVNKALTLFAEGKRLPQEQYNSDKA